MDTPSKSADNVAVDTKGSQGAGPQPFLDGEYDPAQVVGEVDTKYNVWRQLKRPIEIQWFTNNAMVRGVQQAKWNDATARLEQNRVPANKIRPSINKILPKARQRKAKLLKNRYVPIIVPATSDREDKLNAQASEKALNYVARKGELEQKYRKAVDWGITCGKGFIWIYWDETIMRMAKPPAMPGQAEMPPMLVPLGDVCFEGGNPFEVLVPDIGIERIGEQPEVMRVRAVPLQELIKRFSHIPGIANLRGDTSGDDVFQYQKQIATLATRSHAGLIGGAGEKADKELNYVVRKELWTKPNGTFPKGRYVVTAGGIVLRYQEELPYGFAGESNPYPVVEFPDIELAGQFWPTSIVEQLIGPQKEYNDYRAKLINHLAKQSHPKLLVSVLSKFPENSWNDDAGEVIRYMTPPNIPAPQVVFPPPIAGDIWKAMQLLENEMYDISGLPPAAGGNAGETTSGFQVNLLQEAADSVHAPDIRSHELAFEELYGKARKIMAQGYDIPRLISVAGRAHIPDVVEFSQNNIDEQAEIIVYTGSALSTSPAVRTQQVIELWNSGMLQDDMNPAEGKRRALTMLDNNGIGELQEEKRRDEEKARLENLNIGKGQYVAPPLPFDNHEIQMAIHSDQCKSPEFDTWDDNKKREIFAHMLYHTKFINPDAAMQLAMELGLPELIPMLQPAMMPTLQPQQPQGPGQPPPAGGQQPQMQPPPPDMGGQAPMQPVPPSGPMGPPPQGMV